MPITPSHYAAAAISISSPFSFYNIFAIEYYFMTCRAHFADIMSADIRTPLLLVRAAIARHITISPPLT